MNRVIWVSWQSHRRTDGLSKFFGISLFIIKTKQTGLFRYILLSYRTLKLLANERPEVLIVQNPSLILTVLACILRPIFRYQLIVDAHNEGVVPYVNSGGHFVALTRLCHRLADVTIVTNEELARVVEGNGGKAVVLPDSIPQPPEQINPSGANEKGGPLRITIISTYAKDEPIAEIFRALHEVKHEYRAWITGDDRKCPDALRRLAPKTISFTGFLDELDYWQLLADSDLIIDLTLMENCLVCGLYEAMSLGVPIMLTDDVSARRLVPKGTVFTKADKDSIKNALDLSGDRLVALRTEMWAMAQAFRERWRMSAENLSVLINEK